MLDADLIQPIDQDSQLVRIRRVGTGYDEVMHKCTTTSEEVLQQEEVASYPEPNDLTHEHKNEHTYIQTHKDHVMTYTTYPPSSLTYDPSHTYIHARQTTPSIPHNKAKWMQTI